jgi:galactose mutarotase-like enzyme
VEEHILNEHVLKWSHGTARVVDTAATVTDCEFLLPGGTLKPFARAPWVDQMDDPSVSGHHRVLSGDFVGLPFGTGRELVGAPESWAKLGPTTPVKTIHGPAADEDWTIVSGDDGYVTLRLDYPEDSPVDHLERTIRARDGAPALDFELKVFARRAAKVSAGLHPNFRFPDAPGRLEIKVDFAFGLTHPGQTPPGQPQEFADLTQVPKGDERLDMSHLPLSPPIEKNILLCGVEGPVRATWLDEGKGIEMEWDRELMPSLMFWHTVGAMGGGKFEGQFRGLGLEPLASAFDLHTDLSAGPNPINERGIKTSLAIDPAAPVVVRHSISAFTV